MNDPSFPSRLSAGEDDLVREVLGAAKGETMAPARVARTLATFEASRLASASRGGAAGDGWRLTRHLKLGASLAVACAVGIGWLTSESFSQTPAPPPPAPVAMAHTVESSLLPEPPREAATRVEDLPAAPMMARTTEKAGAPRLSASGSAPPSTAVTSGSTPSSSAVRSVPSHPPASSSSSFHEELALVEAARAALAQGNTDGCLQALDRYDARFHRGVFADEIVVMRIETLVARGERDRARVLADALLTKNPDSAYAGRIRSILPTTP
jgi:hypothetical protein